MLSVVAQAMSKAAASLAAVSGYEDEDFALGEGGSEDTTDWAESPDWTRSSYKLPLPSTTIDNDLHAFGEGYRLTVVDKPPTKDTIETSTRPECDASFVEIPSPASQAVVTPELPVEPIGQSSPVMSNAVKLLPATPASTKDTSPPDPGQNLASMPAKTIRHRLPSSLKGAAIMLLTRGHCQSSGPTYIILKHGFDLLPALCYIANRYAKTVCLYNYSGLPATTNTAVMLRANVMLPVMVPESGKKQAILAEVASEFSSAQSGILLWPGCKTLPTINGLANSPNIQLVHLGEPHDLNTGITCPKTTVILARSDLTGPQTIENRYSQRTLDVTNYICNQQSPESPLQPFRVWLRSRLAKDSYARAFYLDWILQRRKRNPREGIVEIVRLANQYAEEFLLRGRSRTHGAPIGGQLTIPKSTLKGQKLEAAIQAGVLLVS
ncbi:unnamed protein product [Rhizoctonia solani]|uniref:Uncharacterized protein n=1 Tax=Rhizoctonia solani TaxID=456999 RepID=A0A8H3H2N3_9AGAM|nr:unnamed protein product [Rhizoctonia solani]